MKLFRIDLTVVCFTTVLALAVLVAFIRAHTYQLGYQLASLKSQERSLRQTQNELQTQLAEIQRSVRDKYATARAGKSTGPVTLPGVDSVVRPEKNPQPTANNEPFREASR